MDIGEWLFMHSGEIFFTLLGFTAIFTLGLVAVVLIQDREDHDHFE